MAKNKQLSTTPLRLQADLKEWAKIEAAKSGQSLNGWIVELLTELRKQAQTVN